MRYNNNAEDVNVLWYSYKTVPKVPNFYSQLIPARRVAINPQWGAILGVWGRRSQPPEVNEGLGEEPPALENFAFFCKNNLILGLLK